ncbi:response regulator transcription factor [Botrimarina mediterranea]|uniref:Transcriptional regulatory protein FixJ n=1 Tax=Botrimarina mediterranea TaxID=2528022 RepID=A0A518K3M1_9BACT|nr:response regulator [Botrimarina mediterranea]QDV72394.1 Transcriptional regulatory protein FixJ [Botrimarina mediterranea]QDV76940.1 Transcriptional regulatory protein FixJ [Planctomycetes bacterium K2D]
MSDITTFTAGAESNSSRATIYIVESHPHVRDSVADLVTQRGYRCQTFASAEDFLAAGAMPRPGVLVLDYNVPGVNGRDVQDRLAGQHEPMPIIVTIGQADVPAAIQFMERCAVTVLEKPYQADDLITAIDRAVEHDQLHVRIRRRFEQISVAVSQLSTREKTVLQAIVEGQLNKAIARSLDVSVRTIEGDRAKIVEKFSAETTGEVVGLYAQYNLLTELGYLRGKSARVCC